MQSKSPGLVSWTGRQLLWLVLYGILLVGILWLVADMAGYTVSVYPRQGWDRETSAMSFEPPTPEAGLEDDFPDEAEIRNVILLIADGLGFAHVVGARSELEGIHRRLGFERMPVTGWQMTHSVTSLITDSGASATAMATGEKTGNGTLAQRPSGRTLRTAAEAAREAGRSVGLVTDSYLWDATPAAFVTHVKTRRNTPEVTAQMSTSGAELLIGELAGEESEAVMPGRFAEGGYAVARTWEELRGAAPGPLAGLLDPGRIAAAEAPTLAELAGFAVDRLSADPDGFFLMVETEETDSASHNHQFQRMVAGVRSLDKAAARALEFARRDRSTLVLVTADHETGGLVLLSGGKDRKLGIQWTTRRHSAVPVPIYAYGPGARRFSGVLDNTDIGRRLIEILSAAPTPEPQP